MTGPSPTPTPGLADVIAPCSVATLFEHVSLRRPLHLPAARPDRFDHLFSWSRLDQILARGRAQTDRVFVFAGGRQVDAALMGVVKGADCFDPAPIRSLFRQGATFSLANVQDNFEETRALVADTQALFGEHTELRVVASPRTGGSIPVHFDPPDLLVLQIEGAKHWTFLGQPVEASAPRRAGASRPADVTGEAHMRRGDALFLPSGLHHRCLPDGDSLHLALSIYRVTRGAGPTP